MQIKIGYDLVFEAPAPTAMLLMLFVHPSRDGDLRSPEILQFEPDIPVWTFRDGFGNKVGRVVLPAGETRIRHETFIQDSGQPDVPGLNAMQHPVEQLPTEMLPYLLSSRYCEVDRMVDIAWTQFGHTQLGWPRVQAVMDWVHNHVTFGYKFANSLKSAYDTYIEQKGVCRDFMHLSVTLLRALNIPARYVTGYLGDIGVPIDVNPMDFSAWFQVYLGDRWWTCDARHNHPRIGRVLMATGRDATDVALTTSFGPTILKKFVVVTDEVK